MNKFTKVAFFLVVLVALFCVFSCGSEEEKAKAALLKEKHIPIPKECDSLFPKIDINHNFTNDSAAFMECYNKHNSNKDIKCEESEFNEYSVCAVIHPKIFGFPRECLNLARQKDSLSYYSCCKKYNSCWMFVHDYEISKSIPKQLEYEWVNLGEIHSIEDDIENPPPSRNIFLNMKCFSPDSAKYQEECKKLTEEEKKSFRKRLQDPRTLARADSLCKMEIYKNNEFCNLFKIEKEKQK